MQRAGQVECKQMVKCNVKLGQVRCNILGGHLLSDVSREITWPQSPRAADIVLGNGLIGEGS